jgi:hypothetical protein
VDRRLIERERKSVLARRGQRLDQRSERRMLPKARIPDPGPKALESIRLSVFVPGGKTAGHHPTSGWHDLEDHGGGEIT